MSDGKGTGSGSGRGGARRGAGRPKGTHEVAMRRARQNIAHAAEAAGLLPIITDEFRALSPLQIMSIASQVLAQEGDWKGSASIAEKLAPYMHPRLQNITMTAEVKAAPRELTEEELIARIAQLTPIAYDIIEQEDDKSQDE